MFSWRSRTRPGSRFTNSWPGSRKTTTTSGLCQVREFEVRFCRRQRRPDATRALFQKVGCHYHDYIQFSDLPAILSALPTYDEKLRCLEALNRHSTLLVRLRITADSDPDALSHYWGRARAGKNLKPFFKIASTAAARRRERGPDATAAAAPHRAAVHLSAARRRVRLHQGQRGMPVDLLQLFQFPARHQFLQSLHSRTNTAFRLCRCHRHLRAAIRRHWCSFRKPMPP